MIVGQQGQALGPGFGIQKCLQIGLLHQFEHFLGHAQGKGRTVGQLLRVRQRDGVELAVGNHAIDQTQGQGLLRIDATPGIDQILGAQRAQMLGQEIHRAAIGHQPDMAKHLAEACSLRLRVGWGADASAQAAQIKGSTSPIGSRSNASARPSIGVAWLFMMSTRAPACLARGTAPATG